MVKYVDQSFTYPYSFPSVTLAYFLRYPNPHSTHVLSTDTLSSHLDPVTNLLTTTRLHHKRSRIPPAIIKLLPASVAGGGVSASGNSSSYILETTVVDIRNGAMYTESRNLDWVGILSVVEKQTFRRDVGALTPAELAKADMGNGGSTDVTTTVKFRSRLGEKIREKVKGRGSITDEDGEEPKRGFFASLTMAGVQRSIEAIASRKGEVSQGNSKRGMTVVLERLRSGGMMAVLEGMRRDRKLYMEEKVA